MASAKVLFLEAELYAFMQYPVLNACTTMTFPWEGEKLIAALEPLAEFQFKEEEYTPWFFVA